MPPSAHIRSKGCALASAWREIRWHSGLAHARGRWRSLWGARRKISLPRAWCPRSCRIYRRCCRASVPQSAGSWALAAKPDAACAGVSPGCQVSSTTYARRAAPESTWHPHCGTCTRVRRSGAWRAGQGEDDRARPSISVLCPLPFAKRHDEHGVCGRYFSRSSAFGDRSRIPLHLRSARSGTRVRSGSTPKGLAIALLARQPSRRGRAASSFRISPRRRVRLRQQPGAEIVAAPAQIFQGGRTGTPAAAARRGRCARDRDRNAGRRQRSASDAAASVTRHPVSVHPAPPRSKATLVGRPMVVAYRFESAGQLLCLRL